MNLSYWEKKSWFSNVDFCVVGSGIVGLNCAIRLKQKYPKSKIIVIEKGILPQGASTKNAGFACFGSVSEMLDDLNSLSEEQLFSLVKQRVEGLELLKKTLGRDTIDFQANGGYEVFLKKDKLLFEESVEKMETLNTLLYPIFNSKAFIKRDQVFNFKNVYDQCIFNKFEAQIDTGKMVIGLLKKATSLGILIVNATQLKSFIETNGSVKLLLDEHEFLVKQLFIATNAFAKQFLDIDMKSFRNQVIISKPLKNCNIKGTFHLDRGYYYFRNIDNRILLGGGRHLDPNNETTSRFGLSNKIQTKLEELLKTIILPNQDVEIDMRWSGILGMGPAKEPIVTSISDRIHCGVRLGGMGVAIGSMVGFNLAELA